MLLTETLGLRSFCGEKLKKLAPEWIQMPSRRRSPLPVNLDVAFLLEEHFVTHLSDLFSLS